jgi:hypothetical protein
MGRLGGLSGMKRSTPPLALLSRVASAPKNWGLWEAGPLFFFLGGGECAAWPIYI